MGSNDISAILILVGLGYLYYNFKNVAEVVTKTRKSTTSLPIMISPIWIPPDDWTPLPMQRARKFDWVWDWRV